MLALELIGTLFRNVINDLERTLDTSGVQGLDLSTLKLFILLYADDAVLLSETREDLQLGLNTLHDYCKRWKMILNTDKTKIVVFRAGGRLARLDKWYYGNVELDVVSHFSYLGIVLSQSGSFSRTQQTLAKQGKKALFSMFKMVQKFRGLSPLDLCDLFDKLVVPVLTYGSEIWGFHKADAVEKVHREFMRRVLRVKGTTANEFLYGELGRKPLIVIRYCRIIKYWFKLLKAPEGRLNGYVYGVQKQFMEEHVNKTNWASLLKDLLCEHGFGEVWYSQGVGCEEDFMVVFKQRLSDVHGQNWYHDLEQSLFHIEDSILFVLRVFI